MIREKYNAEGLADIQFFQFTVHGSWFTDYELKIEHIGSESGFMDQESGMPESTGSWLLGSGSLS